MDSESSHFESALTIRLVEEAFLKLFSEGEVNGTVHTSVGQELSALAFAGQLYSDDFVISNHRCHGHFIAFTKEIEGLIAELMGKKSGVCGGVGGSQHLNFGNFFSNGIQGGMTPFATGLAQSIVLNGNDSIVVIYIGDGTLGEGVLYESLNILGLLKLPVLIVCENNFYAQSTKIADNLSGNILKRANAFGLEVRQSNTFNNSDILSEGLESINYVRGTRRPLFHLVDTYRLNAHSKGDDDRSLTELEKYKNLDFLMNVKLNDPSLYETASKKITIKIKKIINKKKKEPSLLIDEYIIKNNQKSYIDRFERKIYKPKSKERQSKIINQYFHDSMEKSNKIFLIGEDIKDPYGGAFKITKGLSTKFPNRVFSSPISEAAITGMSIGLAVGGFKPFVEIMFGDFLTLCSDQIINHAAKFRDMYNKKILCPIVIRTPMGGGRGYGPTHSQSIENLFMGIYSIKIIALNIYHDPYQTMQLIEKENFPIILIENKKDYGKKIFPELPSNYKAEIINIKFSPIYFSPIKFKPNLTIICYGGLVNEVLESVSDLFYEFELIAEVISMTQISPIRFNELYQSIEETKNVLIVEEGVPNFSFSSEIAALIFENFKEKIKFGRVGSKPVAIPTEINLEKKVLPSRKSIINYFKEAE
jgi:2-oxoisovalerate dehydrogenase E1 component